MSKEIWKKIKGLRDVEVSNLGRVRRIWDHKVSYLQPIKARTKRGTYLKVSVTDEKSGVQSQPLIHVLVAEAHVSKPKDKGEDLEVNHKDGDKWNNRASNLKWVTRSENVKHSYTI